MAHTTNPSTATNTAARGVTVARPPAPGAGQGLLSARCVRCATCGCPRSSQAAASKRLLTCWPLALLPCRRPSACRTQNLVFWTPEGRRCVAATR